MLRRLNRPTAAQPNTRSPAVRTQSPRRRGAVGWIPDEDMIGFLATYEDQSGNAIYVMDQSEDAAAPGTT